MYIETSIRKPSSDWVMKMYADGHQIKIKILKIWVHHASLYTKQYKCCFTETISNTFIISTV